MEGSDETYLAAGTLAGIVVVTFTSEAYHGVETSSQAVVHERMLETTADGTQIDERRHWEPASAITTVLDAETKTNILHFGTVGGYTLAMVPTLLHNEDSFFQPPWKHSFDDIRERFDIDRDLGGLAVGRLWGLASYGEFVVAAVTIQPGDMIEYRTATEERTTLIFSRARSQITELDDTAMHPTIPDRSADYLGAKRETVLGYILFFKDGKFDKQPWSHKILYATACCAIVESHDTDLLSQARKALKWLANKIPANLTEEINKCSTPGSTIGAKSAKELSGPGQLVFEKCEICDTGIAWYSGREAQCVEGHVFVRCGLTSLSIQDPGISKFCSVCATEYLNEDLVEASYGTDIPEATRILFDAFDTCIYCNGKFCA
ncbi:uncharacterized protein ATNIH1004_002263 [Aspergillus tanneri]|uniref:Uncharacterized protein n=1 Tax=Aspergillus tanneri TaxID=1220188 RepID=A0A5M9MR52_9EURO|nr:uncharacterized protein ATNIH1004_002263 [Aspergillus tanneri]KAA8649592.1 hypothetical protein ATNIH1004_002263 [Aspergillus tanneri]